MTDTSPLLELFDEVADLFDPEPEWQDRALCAQTDPEAFFPEKGGSTREAKQICQGCDVRSQCLQYALERDERFGIWGGLSERERRKLKRALTQEPPASCEDVIQELLDNGVDTMQGFLARALRPDGTPYSRQQIWTVLDRLGYVFDHHAGRWTPVGSEDAAAVQTCLDIVQALLDEGVTRTEEFVTRAIGADGQPYALKTIRSCLYRLGYVARRGSWHRSTTEPRRNAA